MAKHNERTSPAGGASLPEASRNAAASDLQNAFGSPPAPIDERPGLDKPSRAAKPSDVKSAETTGAAGGGRTAVPLPAQDSVRNARASRPATPAPSSAGGVMEEDDGIIDH